MNEAAASRWLGRHVDLFAEDERILRDAFVSYVADDRIVVLRRPDAPSSDAWILQALALQRVIAIDEPRA